MIESKELAKDLFLLLEERFKAKKHYPLPRSHVSLDILIDSLISHPCSVGVFGDGKTAFLLAIALRYAIRTQKPVRYFCDNMTPIELGERLLSHEASVAFDGVRSGCFGSNEWSRLARAAGDMTMIPISFGSILSELYRQYPDNDSLTIADGEVDRSWLRQNSHWGNIIAIVDKDFDYRLRNTIHVRGDYLSVVDSKTGLDDVSSSFFIRHGIANALPRESTPRKVIDICDGKIAKRTGASDDGKPIR